MFDQMGGDIEIRLEDKEEHEDRHCRLDPEHLQGKDHDAAEDDGQVHGDDPLVRPEELLNDVYGSFRLLVPVSEIRVEVIYKEEGTGEPDVGIREMNGSKEPGFHNKGVISPVEETVVNGEEPGNEALVVPEVAGVDRALPTPRLYRFFEICCKGSGIGTKERDDREDADDDALRPVDEQYRCKVPVPEDSKYNGN